MKLHALKRLMSFVFCFTLVVSLATFGNPATTSADTISTIGIDEFTFLDDGYDYMSIAYAKPDAVKDGHFKLSLDLAKDIEIKAMWVRTTDKAGKINYHGTWKTSKEGIGYLLGIYEDNKVLNPEFKTTLGTFKKGKHTFDLYGTDNNGGIKEGEYYYIELITSEGNISSGLTPYVKVELSNGVEILKFASVGTTKDKVGIDGFKTDKRKDLHLKLMMDIPEKTEIISILLKTTDDQGKVDYQGTWRTNRLGVGWFLGLEQDGKPITKSFKEPLGSFKGIVYLDMYATDDLKYKEDEYFVLEITTPKGAITSEPVKYDELEGLSASEKVGTVKVENADPDSTVALYQVTKGTIITLHAQAVADRDGEAVFENVPTGTGYYVRNNNNYTFPFEVTAVKAKTLIDEKSIKFSFKNKKDFTQDLTVNGKFSDSDIESLEYTIGTISKQYDLTDTDGKFSFTENINLGEGDVLTLVATDTKGKVHIIRRSIESDLVEDRSLQYKQLEEDFSYEGNWSGKAAKEVFAFQLIDGKYETLEVKKLDIKSKTFKFNISTESDSDDIVLVVIDKNGNFERLVGNPEQFEENE
ncbi:hypothetical protein [Brevibacillus sp. SYSU BS000544]|uniref:hypothetical protein n=1 Tax=Brevibacillus sp. SYSU BS000544 TaxID=3416443 RepID=UPI003CE47ECB